MTQRSAAATDAAQRLWARNGKVTAPREVAAEVERVCAQLWAGLDRWVGREGYGVLLDRALKQARPECPALAELTCRGGDEQVVIAAVRTHGAAAVATGMVTLVATVIDLLARMIGEEMAVKLIERAAAANAPGAGSRVSAGGRDG